MTVTAAAFLTAILITFISYRQQNSDSNDTDINTKHSRQDLRLIAYFLFAILITLGIIADRIH